MGDLQIIDQGNYEVPAEDMARSKLTAIMGFQKLVKSQLRENEDFGTIPGTKKPSLFKSGAEKILSILGVSIEIREKKEIKEKIEIEGVELPYFEFSFILRGTAGNGKFWEATGSCNTLEKKYCKKVIYKNGSKAGEELIKDISNYYGLRNTIEKMADKRAMVALSLKCGALSNIFTQDVEDMDLNHEPEEKQTPVKKQTNSEIDKLKKEVSDSLNDLGISKEIQRNECMTAQKILGIKGLMSEWSAIDWSLISEYFREKVVAFNNAKNKQDLPY